MAETEETKEISVDKDIHFTYKEHPEMNMLCQGDVLEKNGGIVCNPERSSPVFFK